MAYLLDSNVCIALINRSAPQRLLDSLNQTLRIGDGVFVPSVVVHELWYGVAKSQRFKANAHNLREFLREPFQVLNFDAEDAQVSGEIRASLNACGTPIGPYDVLIAGQALARGLTLITANTREFSRVDGLKLADWAQ